MNAGKVTVAYRKRRRRLKDAQKGILHSLILSSYYDNRYCIAMVSYEELELYFYVFCGVTACCIVFILILICILFIKVNRLTMDDSNQLGRQANMMAEFCYTNPTIVPGEELSRRGFSMYSGSDNFIDEYGMRGNKYVASQHETRSKF